MVGDIRGGRIDKVWVYEHSRISRNVQNSSLIFTLFDKYKVRVFEKDRELDLKDNTSQFLRHILDATSQYERNLIVGRTTRGLYSAIDSGRRTHGKLYGYRSKGKDLKGKLLVEPEPSEIETLKFFYERYLKGGSIRNIALEMDGALSMTKDQRRRLSNRWGKILRHFEYTGYALNTKGLDILHRFDRFEIDNLKVLNDEKYYVKSREYREQLLTVEEWITVAERLRINRKKLAEHKESYRYKKASKSMASGIIHCSDCDFKYHPVSIADKRKKNNPYYYYRHDTFVNDKTCMQKPKSFPIKKIDEIFKLFYFFFYIVFDNGLYPIW
jgi:DNA invertase Pin-like site-specific DNA recombinase